MTKFGEFRVGDLFDIHPTKHYGLTNDELYREKGSVAVLANSSQNNGIGGYVGRVATERGNRITFSDTVSSDGIFYQRDEFIGYSHVQGMYPRKEFGDANFTQTVLLYIVSAFRKSTKGLYDYGSKFTRENASETVITLPMNPLDNTPNYDYMDKFVKRIQGEYVSRIQGEYVSRIQGYLTTLGFSSIEDVQLTDGDIDVLKRHENANFREFRPDELFDTIKRGKRIRSIDRVAGDLPFITAGLEKFGFSSNISRDSTEIFPKSSLTIDMFGNTFYRGYEFGADDHIAVLYDTAADYSRGVLEYIQPHINKAITGKFSYSRNFYASDAPDIVIKLPSTSDKSPDFTLMRDYIKVIEKKTVQKLRKEMDARLAAYQEVISND